MNIAITGGSGFVGTALSKKLIKDGHAVTVYDRIAPRFSDARLSFVSADLAGATAGTSQTGNGDGANNWADSIATHDAIVHLAGVSIYERWTPAYKDLILSSRINSTRTIVRACAKLARAQSKKSAVLVCASAIGYYGNRGDEVLSEEAAPASASASACVRTDFLSDVCVAWEAAAAEIEDYGIRRVSVRTAIVLGPGGGMMAKLVPLFRWNLGGRLGSGRQWFSWIHIDDLVAVYSEAVTNATLQGAVNATAPEPVTNKVFTRALAKTLHRVAPWIVPGFLLQIILGEFAQAVLASTRAVPTKLLAAGFRFAHPTIESALGQALK